MTGLLFMFRMLVVSKLGSVLTSVSTLVLLLHLMSSDAGLKYLLSRLGLVSMVVSDIVSRAGAMALALVL